MLAARPGRATGADLDLAERDRDVGRDDHRIFHVSMVTPRQAGPRADRDRRRHSPAARQPGDTRRAARADARGGPDPARGRLRRGGRAGPSSRRWARPCGSAREHGLDGAAFAPAAADQRCEAAAARIAMSTTPAPAQRPPRAPAAALPGRRRRGLRSLPPAAARARRRVPDLQPRQPDRAPQRAPHTRWARPRRRAGRRASSSSSSTEQRPGRLASSTRSMCCGSSGRSEASVSVRLEASTASMPRLTRPKTVCLPSSQGALFGRDDEELRAVRVRARVRHRQRAPDDLVLVDLVLERVAGAAGAGSLRAAALDHEVLDHAVEDEAVVEAVAGELEEVRDGLRRVLVEQLELDRAGVGVEGGLGHGRSLPASLSMQSGVVEGIYWATPHEGRPQPVERARASPGAGSRATATSRARGPSTSPARRART